MATFNGERHIQEQLDSLARQTLLPYELIVTDDRSTDATCQIVLDFAQRSPFPVHLYINETKLGFSDNFLRAASLCKGDWIAFCDQDDVWMPQKLERIQQAIKRYQGTDLVMVGHTSLLSNEELELTGQRLPDYPKNRLVKRASNYGFFCIVGFSMVCHAKLIRDFDLRLRPRVYREADWTPPGHDQWLGMLANAVGDIACVSEPLAVWRRHKNSLTRPPGPKNIMDEIIIAKAALLPDPFFLLGDMANESGDSLRNIAGTIRNPRITQRLMGASDLFYRLAKNLYGRGQLYSRQRRSEKILALATLLKDNAYLGPKFCSLGWKSFAKDVAFAVGIIG